MEDVTRRNARLEGTSQCYLWHGVANGRTWMNGFASKPEDKQSTLSRYWTTERPRTGVSHYQAIKRACREKGVLWEDPDFAPGPKALYKNKKPPFQPIVWMRPHEMCQCPVFSNNSSNGSGSASGSSDATRLSVDAGELGDPWLLAAASSLALTPRFLERVVPPDQDFEENYSGMFRFRFWHFGEWKEVLVDDRLPTFRGRLIYLHSSTTTEFWASLMEKAYAKLYGNYENLSSGSTTRSLQDLTGGIVQSFGLSHQDRYLTFQVLNSAVPRSSLLIATITPDKEKRQLRLRNGLLTHHAYSVTGLARVRGQGGETPLVRLRGARGRGHWAGAWSAGSWEWQGLSDRDRELLSVRVTNDGEFWMSFEDFSKHFTQLELVHVGPDDWMSEPALHSKQPWRAVLARRRWRAGYNAGGGPQYIETTAMNPQFHVQIPRANSNKCHVVVSVTQYYDTRPPEDKNGRKKPLVAIGFAVYEVPHSMPRLTPHFVADQKPLDVTNHSVAREVVTFFTLPPGDYIVVPQTNMPNIDGKFLLRIFTDEQSNIWEVNEDNMVVRNISSEFMDDSSPIQPETKAILSKLFLKHPPEVDASTLQKILRSHWKNCLTERPSLELCRSLIMMRDYNISGRIHLRDIPALMHMLQFWKLAFQKYAGTQCGGKTSSYRLRPLLREAGAAVSNKVLECLVLRFAKSRVLTAESYIMAMVRLHLAHERYHSLDTKMKTNPLSLEEMILMTIYS
ncbi:calpain-1 catalytic subunit-like isoform X2 [Arctopsyche grandis]|uniref:calpain-1 catalytic subunit-like isoform X2 n=1 Tax=Arctopsyche grandis TaxID=121162 RepID=UPI00406D8182